MNAIHRQSTHKITKNISNKKDIYLFLILFLPTTYYKYTINIL